MRNLFKICFIISLVFVNSVFAQTVSTEWSSEETKKTGDYVFSKCFFVKTNQGYNILTSEKKNFSTDKFTLYSYDDKLEFKGSTIIKMDPYSAGYKPELRYGFKDKLIFEEPSRIFITGLSKDEGFIDEKDIYTNNGFEFLNFSCSTDSTKCLIVLYKKDKLEFLIYNDEFDLENNYTIEYDDNIFLTTEYSINNKGMVCRVSNLKKPESNKKMAAISNMGKFYDKHITLFDEEGVILINKSFGFDDVNLRNGVITLLDNEILGCFGFYPDDDFEDDYGVVNFKMDFDGEVSSFEKHDLHNELIEEKKIKIDDRVLSLFELIEYENGYVCIGESYRTYYNDGNFKEIYKPAVILTLDNDFISKDVHVINKSQDVFQNIGPGSIFVKPYKNKILAIYTAVGSTTKEDQKGTTYQINIDENGEKNKKILYANKEAEAFIDPENMFKISDNEYFLIDEAKKKFKVGLLRIE